MTSNDEDMALWGGHGGDEGQQWYTTINFSCVAGVSDDMTTMMTTTSHDDEWWAMANNDDDDDGNNDEP